MPEELSAADLAQDDLVPVSLVNAIKNNWVGYSGDSPPAGIRAWDPDNDEFSVYDAASFTTLETGTGTPEGSIVAWAGGYFTDGSNGGYTYVLGSANSVAGANSYLNSYHWYVCDGSELNDSGSTIFNGSGRYLPNLTDDRFLMGDTAAGSTGGANTMAHTHDFDISSFDSATYSGAMVQIAVGGTTDVNTDAHTHPVDPPNTTSAGASNTENRPLYLSCFFIMKVK